MTIPRATAALARNSADYFAGRISHAHFSRHQRRLWACFERAGISSAVAYAVSR